MGESTCEGTVAFEASKEHLGGGIELAVGDTSLELRREAGDNNLETVTPEAVTLMVREGGRPTRRR